MNPTPRHLHPSPRSPFLPIPLHYTSEIPVIPFYSLSQHTYPSPLRKSPPMRKFLSALSSPSFLCVYRRAWSKSLPIGPALAAPLPLSVLCCPRGCATAGGASGSDPRGSRSPSCIIRDAVACPLALMWSTLLDSAHSSVLSPFKWPADRVPPVSGPLLPFPPSLSQHSARPKVLMEGRPAVSDPWPPRGRQPLRRYQSGLPISVPSPPIHPSDRHTADPPSPSPPCRPTLSIAH